MEYDDIQAAYNIQSVFYKQYFRTIVSIMFGGLHSLDVKSFQQAALPTINSLRYSYFGESQQQDPNVIISMINELNAQDANEFWHIMSQIYQCSIKHLKKHCDAILYNSSSDGAQSNGSASELSSLQDLGSREASHKVLKSQMEVKAALINTINDFGKSVSHSISDRELCVLVNSIVENDATQQFWNRVAAQVRSKTKKQLYDFYHTSFSKALYDSNITKEDKALIEQLNQEQPEKKPAELAQTFLEQTGRNVLKHNVVMCFVNIRRYASKQRQSAVGKAE
ncbi:Hypothetical_protein [Hexamita inflata]|uniref:Hypothetical_protein n=1 Tax=Hexamita inflata TaxID=28002 RepID=A0AA86U199_9EUKA|nr:Hypothetical protein HINF_LOCUS24016 [Hexamita inflata]